MKHYSTTKVITVCDSKQMDSENNHSSVPVSDIDTTPRNNEAGFTLIEAVLAFVLMAIVTLGVASVFVYAINYNTGTNSRNQALAIAQQQMERYRNARFMASITDSILNAGTTTTTFTVLNNGDITTTTTATGFKYRVSIIIDDNPSTTAVETVANTNLKLITIAVTPIGSGAFNGVTLTLQRSKAN